MVLQFVIAKANIRGGDKAKVCSRKMLEREKIKVTYYSRLLQPLTMSTDAVSCQLNTEK